MLYGHGFIMPVSTGNSEGTVYFEAIMLIICVNSFHTVANFQWHIHLHESQWSMARVCLIPVCKHYIVKVLILYKWKWKNWFPKKKQLCWERNLLFVYRSSRREQWLNSCLKLFIASRGRRRKKISLLGFCCFYI